MYREILPSPLLIVAFGENVVAVHRRTGQVAWRWSHKRRNPRLYVVPGLVFVASGTFAASLDYETGAVRWQQEIPLYAETLLLDGAELFLAGSGEVACVDIASGALLWHLPFEGMGTASVALGLPHTVAQVDRLG